jgi:outer membrane protein
MKKVFKVALVALSLIFAGNFAKAQTKIGYLNFQALVSQMPEAQTIKTQLDVFSKQFTDQINSMGTELQTKGADFQKNAASMTDAVRSVKQSELQDLQKRIQDYQTTAQQKYDEKTNELSKPLIEKAKGAITAVAKEKGYTYVFDTATTTLLTSPEGDDLMVPVKAKLGLK